MNRSLAYRFLLILSVLTLHGVLYAQEYPIGDMIFCLDASGSMNFVLVPDPNQDCCIPPNLKEWKPDPITGLYPTDTRWAFANAAFRQLMTDIAAIIQNDPNGKSPKDGWVGIVQFPDNLVSANAFTYVFMNPAQIPINLADKANFFDDGNPVTNNDIRDKIVSFKPRIGIPGTPMGKGLEKSKEQFQVFGGAGAPIPPHNPNLRAIFLFTDGENNQLPNIDNAWSQAFNKVGGIATELRVYAIGFGNPAELAKAPSELNNISAATQGSVFFYDPNSITGKVGARSTISDLLKLIRLQVLQYLDFQYLMDPSFTLRREETISFDICASEYDSTLFVSVGIEPFQNVRNPIVNIHVSDSLIINANNAANFANVKYDVKGNSQYFAFGHKFLSSHQGEWKVKITAVEEGTYYFHSFGGSSLGFDIRLSPSQPRTGDLLHFEMSFAPGTVAGDSILVKLNGERPSIGLGNLFFEQRLTSDQMKIVFSHKENVDISPAGYKYRYLFNQGRVPSPNFSDLSAVFNDKGKNGDSVAGDGIFTWETAQIKIPDIYKFTFDATGKTSHGGTFCRSEILHTPVAVNVVPNWEISKIVFVPGGRVVEGRQRGEIRMRLMDAYGNILGPSYEKDFDIRIVKGELAGALENDLEGQYVQKISYPPGSEPVITVKYGDLTFPPYVVPVAEPAAHWAISAHYGISNPLGDFGKTYKNNANAYIVDLEYHCGKSPWVLCLIAGRNQFRGKSSPISDNVVQNIVAVGRYHLGRRRQQPFVELGPGYYLLEKGANKFGATAGIGLNYYLASRISLEAGSALHYLFAKGNNLFVQTRVGWAYHF